MLSSLHNGNRLRWIAIVPVLVSVTLTSRVQAQSAPNTLQATSRGDEASNRSNDGGAGKNDGQARGDAGAPLYAWLFLGAGGLMTLAGVALYVGGIASYPSACGTQTNQCPPGTSAATMARASNANDVKGIGIAVGVVGLAALATGISLFYFAPWRTSRTTARVYASPSMGSRFAGFDVGVSF